MQFGELLRFRRDSGGSVPIEVLRALQLPMPDDVFEQFVADHGTNEQFQHQYSHLDLHALRWELAELPASEILACSIFEDFADMVESVASMAREIPGKGWEHVNLPPGAAEYWKTDGTWMRPPLSLRGALVASERALHLVEGHTRTGMLRGLVQSGVLSESSVHKLWIGERCQPPDHDGPWREVLKGERMPFLDWLTDHVGDEGPLGRIALRLIDLKHASRYRGSLGGTDLTSVLECAERDPVLKPYSEVIEAAHADWEHVMSIL